MSDRSERQSARSKAILREVQTSGSCTIHELCQRYQASVATIRRDLQLLEEQGLLRRTHGGAVSIVPLFYEPFRKDASFVDLVGRFTEEKRRIGHAAAELGKVGDEYFMTRVISATSGIAPNTMWDYRGWCPVADG